MGVFAGALGGPFRRVRAGVGSVMSAEGFPLRAVRFLLPRSGLLASSAETAGGPLLRYRLADLPVPLGGALGCLPRCFGIAVRLCLDGARSSGGRLAFTGRGPVLGGQIPPRFLLLGLRDGVAGTRFPARARLRLLQLPLGGQ